MRYLLVYIVLSAGVLHGQSPTTWAATDALGRELPLHELTGPLRPDRTVGIFYFTWLGAHGYDAHTSPLPDEGVMPLSDTADYRSPYDISTILWENLDDPQYGPDLAFHHWGESVFGYYLSDDDWVIAKHAQLLGDAGVDVIVLDVTNAVLYLPQARRICTVFARLQAIGWDVPQLAFLTNSRHVETTARLYQEFYAKQYYPDLWFEWKGKPLLMGNPEGLSAEIQDFFTFRRSWAWTEGQEWFGDGQDKWPWIDHYPQNYGWHDSPDVPEQIAVASAQHPVSNIGRSFHDGRQPAPDSIDSGAGLFFAEQWRRALEVDPEFVFITGWNEWVAMRFTDGKARMIMGQPVAKGETYFVDQYNAEFSRDIEPVRGAFGDNYYYQMVDGIRRYKGTAAPVRDTTHHTIVLDGEFADWDAVRSVYYDHAGDIAPRNHPGWGSAGPYTNRSGRHDLLETRVAEDRENLYVYLRFTPAAPLTTLPDDLQLLLDTDPSTTHALGYDYRLLAGAAAGVMLLQRSRSGDSDWTWETVGEVPVRLSPYGELELRLPRTQLSLGETLQFKWTDKVGLDGDAMRLYSYGDTAPNARFKYVYYPTPR
ncbi:hypothetical protein LEM8419_02757 [Neolewinella maritima]|uniref:Glycosyl hydrolase family 71 n=1 Tax=Neolewinella maritima TaxID=1383882 RepID=A0ABM9B3H5_9BACT|nr:hypothetical protein [Neolewinella maritima]CAH1001849.1 hypothetical protein LEM8419_02757 [Neolewinella maritima]